jgi:hypothetical protein
MLGVAAVPSRKLVAIALYVVIVCAVAMVQELLTRHQGFFIGLIGKIFVFVAIMGLPVLYRHFENKRSKASQRI